MALQDAIIRTILETAGVNKEDLDGYRKEFARTIAVEVAAEVVRLLDIEPSEVTDGIASGEPE